MSIRRGEAHVTANVILTQ